MKIRTPLITALCFVSFLAHANNNYNRPYIGIGLGVMQQNNKYPANSIGITVPGAGPLYTTLRKGGNNFTNAFIGNLNIGYSKLINPKAYLAIEAQTNLRSSKNSFSTNIFSNAVGQAITRIDANHSMKQLLPGFVMALKPGILLLSSGSSIYGVLGTEITRFKMTSQAYFSMRSGGPNPTIPASRSKSSTRCGLLLGLGLDSFINKKSRIGLEYNYVDYGKINSPGLRANDGNSTLILTNNMTAQTHAFLVKLTYNL